MSTSKFDREAFRRCLLQLREQRQLTQADLGRRTGLQPAAISHFETGFRFPTAETLAKLAEALGVTIDALLGREQASPPSGERARALYRNLGELSDEALGQIADLTQLLREREEKKRRESS